MVSFCNSYTLISLIRQQTCYETPENSKCIYLTLTNKPISFQTTCVVETELFDFHRVSVMKLTFQKSPPKLLNFGDYRNFDNSQFMKSINSALSREDNEILEKDRDAFFKICPEVLNKHAPRKKQIR